MPLHLWTNIKVIKKNLISKVFILDIFYQILLKNTAKKIEIPDVIDIKIKNKKN